MVEKDNKKINDKNNEIKSMLSNYLNNSINNNEKKELFFKHIKNGDIEKAKNMISTYNMKLDEVKPEIIKQIDKISEVYGGMTVLLLVKEFEVRQNEIEQYKPKLKKLLQNMINRGYIEYIDEAAQAFGIDKNEILDNNEKIELICKNIKNGDIYQVMDIVSQFNMKLNEIKPEIIKDVETLIKENRGIMTLIVIDAFKIEPDEIKQYKPQLIKIVNKMIDNGDVKYIERAIEAFGISKDELSEVLEKRKTFLRK